MSRIGEIARNGSAVWLISAHMQGTSHHMVEDRLRHDVGSSCRAAAAVLGVGLVRPRIEGTNTTAGGAEQGAIYMCHCRSRRPLQHLHCHSKADLLIISLIIIQKAIDHLETSSDGRLRVHPTQHPQSRLVLEEIPMPCHGSSTISHPKQLDDRPL